MALDSNDSGSASCSEHLIGHIQESRLWLKFQSFESKSLSAAMPTIFHSRADLNSIVMIISISVLVI